MKKQIFLKTFLLLWACFGLLTLDAQIVFPDLSPRATLTQKVGFGEITVDYSRPSMRGRVIFGDLVQFGEVWRTGANQSTRISFQEDVFLNEHKVPGGTYSLFTIPGEHEWTIILNTATRLWGAYGYNSNKDLLRFTVPVNNLPVHVESLTIDIGELTQTTGSVMISWENTLVKFQIGTDADARIVEEIQKKLKNPMVTVANTYYSSANYYLETHRDPQQAMLWADKAIEISGETSSHMTLKAKIYAELDQYQKAVQYAKKAKEQAMKEGNENLVEMNQLLIEKWRKAAGGN